MADKTILVVEDEFGTAEVLQLMLELEGYRVLLAFNGRDALARIAAARPDLVLTDYMMPSMSGAQLGHALRADPTTVGLPIVMMSGVHEAEVRRDFDRYDAFLQKPYRLDQLLPLLGQVLVLAERRASPDRPSEFEAAEQYPGVLPAVRPLLAAAGALLAALGGFVHLLIRHSRKVAWRSGGVANSAGLPGVSGPHSLQGGFRHALTRLTGSL